MSGSWSEIRQWLKHIVAGTIFTLLLLGASAAVFSALAAGISALSSADKEIPVPTNMQTIPTNENTTGNMVSRSYSGNTGTPNNGLGALPLQEYANQPSYDVNAEPSANVPMDPEQQWNYELDHMHSPIGDAMDSGGVYVGERIQETFGHLLKGVLQTLFLEQNDTSQTGNQYAG